jgi:putative DNA primase/helicase
MILEQQIALGLAHAEGNVVWASFSDNYEHPQQLGRPRYALTDAGNSLRFTEDHEGELIYVPGPEWFVWDGKRWLRDGSAPYRAAKETARRIRYEGAAQQDSERSTKVAGWAKQSENRGRLEAMIALAAVGEIADEVGLRVEVDKLDRHPHLLNCANGTVNLKTGRLSAHRKDDYLTHVLDVEYDPKASAPRWEKFLLEIFGGDVDLVHYAQRLSGYTATGENTEKCYVTHYGPSNTGKSTYVETVSAVLGPLAKTSAPDTFIKSSKSSGGIQNDLADLRDARLVNVPETEDGDELARQLIKRVTGRNRIKARFLYKEWFAYFPQFTIWLDTNHLPAIPFSDTATWNRVRPIPFRRVLSEKEQNKHLLDELLRDETPGILTWIVKGAYDWYKRGLGELPLAVAEATFDYRASQDTIGRFLADETEDDADASVHRTLIHSEYKAFCQREGLHPVGRNDFYGALRDRGYDEGKDGRGNRVYRGLRLL